MNEITKEQRVSLIKTISKIVKDIENDPNFMNEVEKEERRLNSIPFKDIVFTI